MSPRLFVILPALFALSTVALSSEPAVSKRGDETSLTERKAKPVDDDCGCEKYYACIDSCAAEYVADYTFCDDTFTAGSGEHAGCMALADASYLSCLEDCGEPSPDC
jgi:hypothetical protein